MKSIAVYCGSSDRIAKEYLQVARDTGKLLAERGIRVIYGAGSTGMMGAVATSAMAAGGEVVGVMPEIFNTHQLALPDTTEFIVTPDMHSRLALIMELAEGFIALPGGYGTMDEFFQTVTWAQIGLHHKPVGLLNHKGYYDKLIDFLGHVAGEGFMYPGHDGLFLDAATPEALLDKMTEYEVPVELHKWLDRE
ncbi:MAG: TIGR00730 family Rossman fold protein [Anaerolineales bacterium]|nr:TIGR00730 family Rossman fold protein [Anaerolineales bacterium]